ncbi:DUF2723 domain-containing protein [bacterium]|nr:DUF2723 domain-containing protein [candidate division CSSED10-310 bacterium]
MVRRSTSSLLFLAFFALFVRTSCSTLYVGDDGDLITAAYMLGIPHPTGYPLFCLLAKAAMLIVPFCSVAQRINLLSALLAALSVIVLERLLRIELHPAVARFGAMLFGLTASFWEQGTIARVYALNILLTLLLLHCIFSLRTRGSLRATALGGLLAGLALGNHVISMVTVALWVGVIAWRERRDPVRHFMLAITTSSLGFSTYLYSVLRSLRNLPLDWGDPEQFANLLAVLTRKTFWYKTEITDLATLQKALLTFLSNMPKEAPLAVSVLAVLGLTVGLARRSRLMIGMSFIGLVSSATVFLHGSEYDLFLTRRYYLPAYLLLAVAAAYAGEAILRLCRWHTVIQVLAGGGAALLLVVMLLDQFFFQDKSEVFILRDYGVNMLRTVAENGTLFALRDNEVFSLIYLRFVERQRQDVALYNTAGVLLTNSRRFFGLPLDSPELAQLEKDIIRHAEAEVYYCESRSVENFGEFGMQPYGVLFKVTDYHSRPRLFDEWDRYEFRGIYRPLLAREHMVWDIMEHYRRATEHHYELQNFFTHVATLESQAELQEQPQHRAAIFIQLGDLFADRRLLAQAAEYFEKACRQSPENHQAMIKLALAYRKLARLDEAVRILEREHRRRPDSIREVQLLAEIHEQGYRNTVTAVRYWKQALHLSKDENQRKWIARHLQDLEQTKMPVR